MAVFPTLGQLPALSPDKTTAQAAGPTRRYGLLAKNAWQRYDLGSQDPHRRSADDAQTLDQLQARRRMLQQLSLGAAAAAGAAWGLSPGLARAQSRSGLALPAFSRSTVAGAIASDTPTSFAAASGYNNFYEFSTNKEGVAPLAQAMRTDPWTLRIEGLVQKPFTLDLDALRKLAPLEERIYRLRCVEGWSMVIPWVGYALSALVNRANPLGSAKYVEMHTLADPSSMPGLAARVLDWPYVEGLRLDEARHPLAFMALGMYGKPLPKQNGAPLRLVVPWKYGFKSIKSVVTLRFTERQPTTAWNRSAPQEYGFYANVNPTVPHPRWSQTTERRIGNGDSLFAPRQRTLMFNGYDVGALYAHMDLSRYY